MHHRGRVTEEVSTPGCVLTALPKTPVITVYNLATRSPAGADPRAVDFRDGRMKGPDEVLILAAATLDGQASASLIFCVGRARARSIHEACEKCSGEALRTRHRGWGVQAKPIAKVGQTPCRSRGS